MSDAAPEVTVVGPEVDRRDEVLTDEALAFLGELHARFASRRDDLLAARVARAARIAAGGSLDFLPDTVHVREDPTWRVAEPPAALQDRRVEIVGPAEPRAAVDALDSGARVWLADLEDGGSPHWRDVVTGQLVLHDAARGTLRHTADDGTEHRPRDDARLATPVVRPRGWHLDERHVLVGGRPAVAALVDVGLHLWHDGHRLASTWSGPFYYLPAIENHLEARLWDDVLTFAEERLDLAHGTVRATVIVETLPAAFEMEEILHELREHACGLAAGSRDHASRTIALLVSTCHRRGALAIGGTSASVPGRHDPAADAVAVDEVRADLQREADAGFDGSRVAHPDLVPVCDEVFSAVLGDRPNQLDRNREDVRVTAADLLDLASTPGQAEA